MTSYFHLVLCAIFRVAEFQNTLKLRAASATRRAWLQSGLGALSAIGSGAVLGYALPRLRFGQHNRPHDFRVEGSSLIIFGSGGTELWRHSFPEQLDESVYMSCDPECDACQFADVDGDGQLETVFRQMVKGGDRRLICLDGHGRVLWEFAPTRTVVDNRGHSFAPPFWPGRFRVLGSKEQPKRVIVSSNHHWSFPNQVAVLDAKTGRMISEYWHRGHLLHMASADLDGDGEPEVLFGGVNDAPEYKRATVVIFDHRSISGASKNPKGGVYFRGLRLGTEKKVIFFPRTPISKNLEFNRVSVLELESGRIRVNVVENTGEEGPFVVYEFDYKLKAINVALSNDLMDRYRELQASGRLPKESFEAITERLKDEIVVI